MPLTQFTPKEAGVALAGMWKTNISTFLWGSPGISKSAIMQLLAAQRGWAFLDMRMSQMRPEDLRGVPFPVDYGGVKGLNWIAPYLLPRDLDFSELLTVEAEETLHKFWNPRSVVNDYYYCMEPEIVAKPLNKLHTAVVNIVKDENDETLHDRCTVELRNEKGELVSGKVRINITGECKVIWALEEFNSANLGVQAAAYELVLDGRIGEYVKPKGALIVAAGNLETDKGITFRLPTPIRNRFEHLHIVPHYPDWNEWAIDKGQIHPQVIGYLAAFNGDLFKFNPTSDEKAFPTPRSWEFVSKIITANEDLSERILSGMVEGAIGGTGVTFMAFRKMANKLPKLDDILSGKLKEFSFDAANKLQLSTALVAAACYKIRDDFRKIKNDDKFKGSDEYKKSKEFINWMAEADNFIAFMRNNMAPDVLVMGVRLAMSTYRLPLNNELMPNFDKFLDDNSSKIMRVRSK